MDAKPPQPVTQGEALARLRKRRADNRSYLKAWVKSYREHVQKVEEETCYLHLLATAMEATEESQLAATVKEMTMAICEAVTMLAEREAA